MATAPSLSHISSEAILWKIATTNEQSRVWQLAARSCNLISFSPEHWDIFLSDRLPELSGSRLVGLITFQTGYPLEIYGLLTENDFYCVGENNITIELVLFLYPEIDRAFVIGFQTAISEWRSRKVAILDAGYFPVRNPFHEWRQLDRGTSEWYQVADAVAAQYLLDEDDFVSMIYYVRPSCMINAGLVEVFIFSSYERCFIRHYYVLSETGDTIYIDGKSAAVFDAWDRGYFELGDELQHKDYLRFFCWALQGDEGQFLIAENYLGLPLKKKPDEFTLENLKKINFELQIHGNRVNESGMAVGPGIISADAAMVYKNALYLAEFAINIESGQMEMLDDVTQLNSTDLVNESFGKKRLGVRPATNLNRYIEVHDAGAVASDPILKSLDELIYIISEKGILESTVIDFPLHLRRSDINKFKSAESLYEIVFQNCTFNDMVFLSDNFSDLPVKFNSCQFKNGFSAIGIVISNSISFTDCTFELNNFEKTTLASGAVVDMSYSVINSELGFIRCRFAGSLHLYSIQASHDVQIKGCSFTPLLISRFLNEVSIATFSPNRRGGFKLGDEEIAFDKDRAVIILDKSQIRGNLTIGSAEFDFQEVASVIGGDVMANNIKVSGQFQIYGTLHVGTLYMAQCEFFGDCLFGYYQPIKMYRMLRGGLQMPHSIAHQTIYFSGMQTDGVVSLYFLKCFANIAISHLKVGSIDSNSSEDMLIFTFAEIKGMLVAKNSPSDSNPKYFEWPTLEVYGDIELSGAVVGHVQICSSIVHGNVMSRMGQFTSLQIGIGWRLQDNGNLQEVTSRIRNLNFENVAITGNVNFTGLEIVRTNLSMERKGENALNNRSGCRLYACNIGGYVSFFDHEIFENRLEDLRRNIHNYPLRDLNKPNIQKQLNSKIADNLEIEGTTIKGHLQISNIDVGGVIILNDSDIGFDLRMDTGYHPSKRQDKEWDLKELSENWFDTRCAGLDMEKVDVGGDLLLDALKIRKPEFPIPGYEYLEGNLHAVGADIRGSVALVNDLFLTEYLRSGLHKSSEDTPLACATVAGNICFTGMHADHLLLLARNFDNSDPDLYSYEEPRLKLDRSDFNKLEIISPTPLLDLSNIMVQDWRFGDDRLGRNKLLAAGSKSEILLANKYLEILHQMAPFDKSVYVNVERKLRNESKITVANAVYRGMMKRAYDERAASSNFIMAPMRKLGSFLHKAFMNYGTAFWLPLKWWVFIFVITIVCLLSSSNIQLSRPVSNLVAINDSAIYSGTEAQAALYKMENGRGDSVTMQLHTVSRADISPHDWNITDAAILASRYCIPFFDLSFQDEWQVAGHMELPILILSLLSYIFLSLFLYGVADKAVRRI